ncbi:hypothetical protein LIER_15128 [Lithospermum erythrorhizon]|uniref:protein-tyrosine-phosphatase n=1 Tax=Lithospermum erythrorhizon TaxID=34254 RepID=A0AAV3Q243_LITER
MPYLVRSGLWIGNIGDAAEELEKKETSEITHILSLVSSVSISFFSEWRSDILIPSQEIRKVYYKDDEHNLFYSLENAGTHLQFIRMAVPLRDMDTQNLLQYLDLCFDFIHQCRKQGSVLVHCFAGVSRSAAIVTAYLMRSENLTREDALESLRKSCPSVGPNDGFLEQLKMYEDMGFMVDHASPIYKRFRLKVLGDSYNRGETIDNSKFGADPGLPVVKVSNSDGTNETARAPTPAYRCKSCRRVVALQDNVLEHVPGEGETSFEWHKRRSGNPFRKPGDNDCSSIFVEPLRWMTTVEDGALEGKLLCAHCEARLGYFNWSGIQCSCGSWITPGFQLHKSKMDDSTV